MQKNNIIALLGPNVKDLTQFLLLQKNFLLWRKTIFPTLLSKSCTFWNKNTQNIVLFIQINSNQNDLSSKWSYFSNRHKRFINYPRELRHFYFSRFSSCSTPHTVIRVIYIYTYLLTYLQLELPWFKFILYNALLMSSLQKTKTK